ncbi:MAG: UDP-glucose/GDP-mannose dehydrogenase family protein [bacterium]|nr:UDP-glucose/GDP-mannose dehydrogenase family protein [bacterium]MBK8128694.1 UDP-glucose/GDP-mannose dehydrogenase family protein [bacterium]
MRISVFGLGYVGCVSAACLCEAGHEVWGIDVDQTKVNFLLEGKSPIVEKELPELIAKHRAAGRLNATTSVAEAVRATDLSLVCVGTPSLPSGALNTEYARRVCEQIGEAIKGLDRVHTVIIRSTLLPGTTRKELLPRLEKFSGKAEGSGFYIAYNPEFLREGSAVADFFGPPKTVIGADRELAAQQVADLYKGLPGAFHNCKIEEAELVKYADNAFHAVKVVFGNEVGAIAKSVGVDSHRVMEIFCTDTKLNLSPYYLKPGFAFGGSCLPKDVRALTACARQHNLETPLLFSLMESNEESVKRAVKAVQAFGKKKVGVLGLAFKAGTDDMRESPVVELVETLLGKGYDLKIYDRNVSLARLMGANKAFIESAIPHLADLLCDSPDEIAAHAEVVLVTYKDHEFDDVLGKLSRQQIVYDLARVPGTDRIHAEYHGICW